MKFIIYFFSFVIGSFIGSFLSLAVYRIPIGEDIVKKHSFCPNCKNKLKFIDLIPILSYLVLKGKCRYCKKTVRIRYLVLEVLSGLVFMIFTMSLNMNLYNFEFEKLIYLIFGSLYIISLILIAGIDKENRNIQKSVLLFGIVTTTMYIVYLYTLKYNVYRYIIYLSLIIIFLLLDIVTLRKKLKSEYITQILLLCTYMAIFTAEKGVIYTIELALLFIAIYTLINLMKKKDEILKDNHNLSIGYYLCISNIIVLILQNFIQNF